MHEYLIRTSGGVVARALAPIIATRVGKEDAGMVEGCARDGPLNGAEGLQPLLVVLVPEGDHPVRPDRGEGPVRVLEGDSVHAVRIGILPVALEGEVVLVGDGLDVLDPNPALDAADGKAGRVGEAADAAGLVLEGGILPLVFTGGGGPHVKDVDLPAGGGNHHETVPDVQVVDTFGEGELARGGGTPSIPELDFVIVP